MASSTVHAHGAPDVHIWGRWEATFTSAGDVDDPVQAKHLSAEFTAPSGARHTVTGFWDGSDTWRVRFSPPEIGTWSYVTRSQPTDGGLDGQSGSFSCVPYSGDNPFYRHGAVRVAPSRRHLEYADGTPYFYLADTAWNVPLLATMDEWEYYLTDRAGKKFNAVQYISTQFRGVAADAEGHVAFTGVEHITIDPAFFQRLDQRIDAINAHGLLAAPILIHAGRNFVLNPGFTLPEEQLIVLTSYMVARYGAHHVLWDFVAEPVFTIENTNMWRRIGRAVFGKGPHHPVTTHPVPPSLGLDEFGEEPWFDIVGYQSGHGIDERTLRWLTEGPPSSEWRRQPTRPMINLEPPYEGFLASRHEGETRILTTRDERRAIYWSLLVSPTAGVCYGAHGVWGWDDGAGETLNHPNWGVARPWREALQLPGSTDMRHLASLMETLPWWQLRPAQDLVAEQPGRLHAERFVTAARTEDGTVAVIYVPEHMSVHLDLASLRQPTRATWFDPATGSRQEAEGAVSRGDWQIDTPGSGDRVLIIQSQ